MFDEYFFVLLADVLKLQASDNTLDPIRIDFAIFGAIFFDNVFEHDEKEFVELISLFLI